MADAAAVAESLKPVLPGGVGGKIYGFVMRLDQNRFDTENQARDYILAQAQGKEHLLGHTPAITLAKIIKRGWLQELEEGGFTLIPNLNYCQ